MAVTCEGRKNAYFTLYETEFVGISENEPYIGKPLLEQNPFIHCSDLKYFWRVSPHFDNEQENLVLLVIETEELDVTVKWEDLEGCGKTYLIFTD